MRHASNITYALIQAILLGGFILAYLAESAWLFHSSLLRNVGGLLGAGGIVLVLAALAALGRSLRVAPAPGEDAVLVTHGVYGWFRHPIYSGIVLLVLGFFLRKPTLATAIASAIVIAYLMLKVRIEERLLRARFPQYGTYARQSFGLLPWFRRGRR